MSSCARSSEEGSKRRWRLRTIGAALALVAAGGGLSAAPPPAVQDSAPAAAACRTKSVAITFDFEGASPARCVIHGEREFTLVITPEHGLPINPSPWYAFRYRAEPGEEPVIHLSYLGARHRYAPKWSDGKQSRELAVQTSEDGTRATFRLPAGRAIVSAQEIVDAGAYRRMIARWSRGSHGTRLILGRTLDRRPIEAVLLGRADAPRLVLLIGRQHPPEVTGAVAMEAFVDRIAGLLAADRKLADRYQFLVVPLLNPDGVALGHWRANRGGKDLNRDWGAFTQPETAAVRQWLDRRASAVHPVLMIDFHSTQRNLFYVQGEEAGAAGERFLASWLAGKEQALTDYPFTIERRDANPGGGTAKNWFYAAYGVPAYTYEVADTADREATRAAARTLAADLLGALDGAENSLGVQMTPRAARSTSPSLPIPSNSP